MKKTLKWSVLMMLTVFGLIFTSCDDDDVQIAYSRGCER